MGYAMRPVVPGPESIPFRRTLRKRVMHVPARLASSPAIRRITAVVMALQLRVNARAWPVQVEVGVTLK